LRLALLIRLLEESNNIEEKISQLSHFFRDTPDELFFETLHLLRGNRPRKIISTETLLDWTREQNSIPQWLFDRSIEECNDTHDAINLLLEQHEGDQELNFIDFKLQLQSIPLHLDEVKKFVLNQWKILQVNPDRYFFNKLITGSLRVHIDDALLFQAMAIAFKTTRDKVSLCFSLTDHTKLVHPRKRLKSKIFLEMYALNSIRDQRHYIELNQHQFQDLIFPVFVSPIWIGVRIQIIKHKSELFVWDLDKQILIFLSSEKLIYLQSLEFDFVVEATIISANQLLEDSQEQKQEVLILEDVIEWNNLEIPSFHERLKCFELFNLKSKQDLNICINDISEYKDPSTIKSRFYTLEFNRHKGLNLYNSFGLFKIQTEYKKAKLVLIYAQKLNQSSSSYFDQYTLASRSGTSLVPVTKVDSIFEIETLIDIHNFIVQNTVERFGPVRSVSPQLVFEIQYSRIEESKRHKAGIVLKDVSLLQFCMDESIDVISALSELKQGLK
jgi:DNA ligase-1